MGRSALVKLLVVLAFVVLVLFAFLILGKYYPGLVPAAFRKTDSESPSETSTFSKHNEPLIYDPDLGVYPGEKVFNAFAEEFYARYSSQEGASRLFESYTYYFVNDVVDRANGEVILSDSGVSKNYLFRCDQDRVFAQKARNFEFLSSGFDFIKTLAPGDYVLSKCLDKKCSTLGPDCIIVKGL